MSSIFLESENFDFGDDKFSKNFSPKWQNNVSSWQKFSRPADAWDIFEAVNVESSLKNLLESMKPSFLVREQNPLNIRQVFLSAGDSPMMLLNKNDQSVLVGVGFTTTEVAGVRYTTFPDIRLAYSERTRLEGWILLEENFDISVFLDILPVLDFPPIFATSKIIANIRKYIQNNQISPKSSKQYDKIRFFEMFSDGILTRKLASIDFVPVRDSSHTLLAIRSENAVFAYEHFCFSENFPTNFDNFYKISKNLSIDDFSFETWEIVSFVGKHFEKKSMKFILDTFYVDQKSVGTTSGYTLDDRNILANSGVLTFTIEEDTIARTIAGHIFIESRGFVHGHEVMKIHKEIIKAVRIVYEQTIARDVTIERGQLVQVLRQQISKICFLLTGKTPIVMPIIISKKTF